MPSLSSCRQNARQRILDYRMRGCRERLSLFGQIPLVFAAEGHYLNLEKPFSLF